MNIPTKLITAKEDSKTLIGIGQVISWLQENNCNRSSTLIAVGGGILQDIATFAAHVYFRGIRWIYVPTTLLSMSDSCIGSKCGINHQSFKNQIGVFHPPSRVLLCPDFVNTLSDLDVTSGYGEILKLILTGSPDDMQDLSRTLSREGLRNRDLLHLVRRCLEIKKQIIEADEYDQNIRQTLNYGHTFGHALEAITLNTVPHGIAVAWGIDLANFISYRLNVLQYQHYIEVHHFIRTHIRFALAEPIILESLFQAATRDKKLCNGVLNLILLARPGSLVIRPVLLDSLSNVVAEYMENHNVFCGY
jgi:3-dehydroquinate synthase